MPHKDKQKRLEYWRKYWITNASRIRDRRLRKQFGITEEQYQQLLAEQHSVCAVCFKPEMVVHAGSKRLQPLAVDHNHETNVVRGLLCSKCNTALGLLDEAPERILALLVYLEKHNG